MPEPTRSSWLRWLLLAVAVIVFVAAAVRLVNYQAERDATSQQVDTAPSASASPQVSGAGAIMGTDAATYVRDRQAALEALPDGTDATAVVSFGSYRTLMDALDVVPSSLDLRSVQYRLPAPGERPVSVDATRDDAESAMQDALTQARQDVTEEQTAVAEMLDSGTIDDPAWKKEHQQRLAELKDLAARLDGAADVVYAVVVHGPVPALKALAEHDGVRLVDPVAASAVASRDVVYGVLPDDTDTISVGRAP